MTSRTTANLVGKLILATSLSLTAVAGSSSSVKRTTADLIVHNSLITTLDPSRPSAQAIAVASGKVLAVGSNDEILSLRRPGTKVVDALGKRVIPGLNDSHSHYLRGGTSFTGELRWDGIPSLKIGLDRIGIRAPQYHQEDPEPGRRNHRA